MNREHYPERALRELGLKDEDRVRVRLRSHVFDRRIDEAEMIFAEMLERRKSNWPREWSEPIDG
jgi:hypothetical protein